MRLAQLARKLSLKPAEIVEFLASRDIIIEDTSNAKIEDTHTEMVIAEFGLESDEPIEQKDAVLETVSPEIVDETRDVTEPAPAIEEEVIDVVDDVMMEQPGETELPKEVIKAPKVELAGLKVVGKIDLPEPKKPVEQTESIDEGGDAVKSTVSEGKPRNERFRERNQRDNRDRKPQKNPIVLQREREEREITRKKREEAKRIKELRTKRYLSKVKPVFDSKPQKRKKFEQEEMEIFDPNEKPKGFFGRIVGWLTAR